MGQTVVAGAYQAIAVGAQRAARRPGQGEIEGDTETLAARLLSQEALGYTERWDAAERELAGLLAVSVVRPLPSLAVVTAEVAVDSVLGLPVRPALAGRDPGRRPAHRRALRPRR